MIAPPEIVQGKPKILLADDQQDVRASIEMLLTLDGHTVVQASNGKEALEAFRKDTFDLVITDHAMPQMKGSETGGQHQTFGPRSADYHDHCLCRKAQERGKSSQCDSEQAFHLGRFAALNCRSC